MKKYFGYILFVVIVSFLPIACSLKALSWEETINNYELNDKSNEQKNSDSLYTCRYDVTGEGSSSVYKIKVNNSGIKFLINAFYYDNNKVYYGKELEIQSGFKYIYSTNLDNVFNASIVFNKAELENYFKENNGQCPTLYQWTNTSTSDLHKTNLSIVNPQTNDPSLLYTPIKINPTIEEQSEKAFNVAKTCKDTYYINKLESLEDVSTPLGFSAGILENGKKVIYFQVGNQKSDPITFKDGKAVYTTKYARSGFKRDYYLNIMMYEDDLSFFVSNNGESITCPDNIKAATIGCKKTLTAINCDIVIGSESTVKKYGDQSTIVDSVEDLNELGFSSNGFSLNNRVREYDPELDTCSNMLGEQLVSYLQTAFTIIKIVSIIIVIVMSMLDFAQNVMSGKEEVQVVALKWAKRLGILIAILLLPAFVDIIGNLIGHPDLICGIK